METSHHISDRLRAWADLVARGYEVPAAAQVMFDAADKIDKLEEEISQLKGAEPRQKLQKREAWINVYPDQKRDFLWPTKEEALISFGILRLATVRVEYEWEE